MSGEAGGTWHQLVPELYYDLIARIPAGMVFWLLVGLWTAPTWRDHLADVSMEHFPFGLAFIALLILAYVIGIVIVPVSNAIQSCYKSWAWKRLCTGYGMYITHLAERFLANTRLADAPPLEPMRMSPAEIHTFQGFLHEVLKHENTHARVILQKMSAEVRLCDNVFAICAGVVISRIVVVSSWQQPMWVWCATTAGLLAASAAPYRYLRLLQRRVAYAFALGYCAGPEGEPRLAASVSPSATA
jgi:hypothetical protein